LVVSGYNLREQVHAGTTYSILSVPGLGQTSEIGKPQLPIKGTLVAIPPGAQVALEILSDQSIVTTLRHPPIPVPLPLVRHDPSETLPRYADSSIHPDTVTYSANQLFPAEAAKIAALGNWRSQRYASIEFHPLQYNPATRQLIVHQRLRVAVTLSYPGGLTAQARGAPQDEGRFEQIFQNAFVNYGSARNWRARPNFTRSLNPVSCAAGTCFKIGVDADGIYRVTCAQLATAMGSTLSVNPDTLQMFKNGMELAINVVGNGWNNCSSGDDGDYVEFFGQAPNAKYTNTNIYWLTFGSSNGKRMTPRDGSGSGVVATTFVQTLHLERNRLYRSSVPPIEDADHWYWTLFYPPPHGVVQSDYAFRADAVATGSYTATLQIVMYGLTIGNHRTVVSINGNPIADTTWSGPGSQIITIPFPQAYLAQASNTITISQPTANDYAAAFLNYMDLSYQSAFDAVNDQIRFRQTASGAWQYHIAGFTDSTVAVFDISDPFNVALMANTPAPVPPCPCAFSFADSSAASREYIALTQPQRKTPVSVTRDTPSNLRGAGNGADYIVVSHGTFLSNVQPLASLRAAQGLRVKVVDVQDVYDEFSDGLVDAQAIRDFLAYGYANWQSPAPAFVLLVGSGNLDPKGYCAAPGACTEFNTPANSTLIPPYLRLVDPWLGEVASDNRLVTFNAGNPLPNMAVGRLPAYTAADVDTMVAKILSYEQNAPTGDWRGKIAFVADNAYSSTGTAEPAGNFWNLSDQTTSALPAGYTVERIYYNPCDSTAFPQCALPYPPYPSNASVRSGIVNAINDGRLVVNYFGHSAIQFWAHESLFRFDELSALANGNKMPMMLEMTCYSGYFAFPGLASLAEKNIRLAGTGSIANWAASGLGVATGHDLLAQGFFDAVLNQSVLQIGAATVLGKTHLWLNGGANSDLIDTFILFGDPATRLAVSSSRVPVGIYLPLVTR
jgi:hypothetical protein